MNELNLIQNNLAQSSYVKVLDESISMWRSQTLKNGGLPSIRHIIRKPEPLGIEFKIVYCPSAGAIARLEIQRGKCYS